MSHSSHPWCIALGAGGLVHEWADQAVDLTMATQEPGYYLDPDPT